MATLMELAADPHRHPLQILYSLPKGASLMTNNEIGRVTELAIKIAMILISSSSIKPPFTRNVKDKEVSLFNGFTHNFSSWVF